MPCRIRRALPFALLMMCASPALADDDDGKREADACQADVHRLCDKFFPDETLVATCLVDRRAELSPACAALLAHPPGIDAKRSAAPDSDPAPAR